MVRKNGRIIYYTAMCKRVVNSMAVNKLHTQGGTIIYMSQEK